jgi:hypothetical protein
MQTRQPSPNDHIDTTAAARLPTVSPLGGIVYSALCLAAYVALVVIAIS